MVSAQHRRFVSDFLILGGGSTGLDLALRLAEHGKVLVLTKAPIGDCNSMMAQGGIAAVLDEDDSTILHYEDTMTAGAGLCNPQSVRLVVENGARMIQHLIDLGTPFDKTDNNSYHLTREGGHSRRRVIHAADATGRAVMLSLIKQAQAHPNIEVLPNQIAIDLITAHKLGHFLPGKKDRCYGCYALDTEADVIRTYQARFTILASGGAGKVYLYTSNPDTATGDGIAMAYRAGCRVSNMEFIQFHPTCLYHPQAKSFLVSEAVRGEGGHLLLADGTRFMERHHPLLELAPRDIVARAIDYEMKRTGEPCVHLDISHKGADFIKAHFPTIYEKCLEFGIDMTQEPIPVVPAAHYTCGGVVTGLQGATDIESLYAIGEVASTGLHGANRLASNSLLECLVFSESAYNDIVSKMFGEDRPVLSRLPLWDSYEAGSCEEEILIAHDWQEIRRFMWDYVGIVRSNQRLARARRRIEMVMQEINEYYWNCKVSQNLIELRNLALVAHLIIRSSQHRKESRGLHYTTDYPERDDARWLKETVLPIE
ncbi:L-aspartate oxidase [Magnetococcus marinus MC-1]|uniref:L-aspartate oxidase n=1 Tax=Magnetococcus marinus (strain ATCC BAA-1437 / JCM 17883 / MC-1) TaxID=156889 RepID=A0L8I5_MAGMM|nr:L-aspartate oxidase [Magnetococcus marinus]ABK44278.1 L-aspartate oxidase [Magnetococcus marinus MC-1]